MLTLHDIIVNEMEPKSSELDAHGNARGTIDYDRTHNRLHTIMPELSAERIDGLRPGKPVEFGNGVERLCTWAIDADGRRWGTLIGVFNTDYIHMRKKDYIYNAAMVSIAGLIVICGIL